MMKWLARLFNVGRAQKAEPALSAPPEPAINYEMPVTTTYSNMLRGSGKYLFDIVGESYYQQELEDICGGKTEDSQSLKVLATIVMEDDNPHDKFAVRVDIYNKTVGYLSKKSAREYRKQLAVLELTGAICLCNAMIVGGWLRDDFDDEENEGSFGVKLDLPISK